MKKTDISDPFMPLIYVGKGKGFSEAHNKAIALISALIYRAGYNVNYDHIVAETPRAKEIPLQLKLPYGKIKIHADISFFLDNETLVLIEVKTLKKYKEVK